MASGKPTIRRPTFLQDLGSSDDVQPARFGLAQAPVVQPSEAARPWLPGYLEPPEPEPEPEPESEPEPEPVVEVAPPPTEVDLTHLNAAIEQLQNLSQRFAHEAEADVLELAIMLARKIVGAEIAADVEPVLATVRAALRRLGESRKVVVRLSPTDAERVQEKVGDGALTELVGAGPGRLELLPDPELNAGDCVVEGDLIAVDGRLDTRFSELRKVVIDAAFAEETA